MSATADTALFARLLATADGPAPVVESAGRMFPVDVRWLPRGRDDRLEPADRLAPSAGPCARRPATCSCSCPASARSPGSPTQLAGAVGPDVDVHRLAGALALEEQDRALAPSPPGRRRVVLATDIAETSLTVDGVRVVVDSGLARAPRFDAGTGHDAADDGVDQPGLGRPAGRPGRAGRAGRRLPAVEQDGARHAAGPPGGRDHPGRPGRARARARRVGHAGRAAVVRRPAAGQGPPPGRRAAARRSARSTTTAPSPPLGRRDGRPARAPPAGPHGRRPARRAVVRRRRRRRRARRAARPQRDGCPPTSRSASRSCAGTARDDRADRRAVDRVRERAADIARRAGDPLRRRRRRPRRRRRRAARRLPRPARRRAGGRASSSCATAPGAWVADDDPLADACRSSSPPTSTASARAPASASAPPSTRRRSPRCSTAWSRTAGWSGTPTPTTSSSASSAASTRCASARSAAGRRPATTTTAALVARVRATRLAVLPWTPATPAAAGPGGVPAPHARRRLARPVRRAACSATLDEWLAPYLAGATGRADLDRLDLGVLLRSHAAVAARRRPRRAGAADVDAADRPGGADRLRRRAARPCRCACRTCSACTVHPTIAGGRVPLTIALLSPADRPIQVTADLPGLLDRLVGRRAQGPRRPLPQAPLARRPRPRAPRPLKPLTRVFRACECRCTDARTRHSRGCRRSMTRPAGRRQRSVGRRAVGSVDGEALEDAERQRAVRRRRSTGGSGPAA